MGLHSYPVGQEGNRRAEAEHRSQKHVFAGRQRGFSTSPRSDEPLWKPLGRMWIFFFIQSTVLLAQAKRMCRF